MEGEDCCDHGQVVIFSGATGRRLHTLQAPRAQARAFFGTALAGVGDINGDGVPDLAVGAPYQDVEERADEGAVVIFSGADGTRLRTLRNPRPQTIVYFGLALARVGDVNDDGVPDLAVGAPGQVVVFSGADGTRLHALQAPSPQLGANFGAALARVGDVNGDGVLDLAVGAPYQDVAGEVVCCNQGQVVIFSGADGTRLHTLRNPRPQDGANFGSVLAGLGDVNGDGVPDLAVGAPFQALDVGCCDHGQVAVFSGADGTLVHTLQAPSPQAGALFGGPWLAWGMSTVMASPTWPSAPPTRMWRTVVTKGWW